MHSLYHLGRILDVYRPSKEIYSADTSVQAMIEMWDENILVFGVHPSLADKVAENQFVLIEYGFHAPNVPVNTIVKILPNDRGEKSWKRMRDFFEQRKRGPAPPIEGIMPEDIMDARMVR